MENNKTVMADPGGVCCFIFATLSIFFWLVYTNLIPQTSFIIIAVAQLAMYPVFLWCGCQIIKMGDGMVGTTYILMATAFTGVASVGTITNYVLTVKGLPFDMAPINVMTAMIGLFIIATLPAAIRFWPWPAFLLNLLAGIANFCIGFVGLGIFPEILYPISGWLLFGVGIIGYWNCFATTNAFYGLKWPVGKPLCPPKK